MMHRTPLCSPTDQGTCAGLSRWGTEPSCVSGSITCTAEARGGRQTALSRRAAGCVPPRPSRRRAAATISTHTQR
eukprot:925352-Prymnesium_polylepis.1